MNRPLETTFWMRFKQFLKGVFLYNTIYWRRASDDLNIRRMSREERASLRPVRNLDIIRPRENPRPTGPNTTLTLPSETAGRPYVPAAPEIREPARPPTASRVVSEAAGEEGLEIHRRKKRRRSRHSQVIPKKYYQAGGSGILGWLFKR